MTSVSASQISLNFEPTLADRFPTLRSYVAHRVNVHNKPAKAIASDMDMSPSLLTRKLTAGTTSPEDKDTQRFNTEDFELYLRATGDAPAIIEYLASKYMDSPEARRARLLSRMESILPEIASALASLKEVE